MMSYKRQSRSKRVKSRSSTKSYPPAGSAGKTQSELALLINKTGRNTQTSAPFRVTEWTQRTNSRRKLIANYKILKALKVVKF